MAAFMESVRADLFEVLKDYQQLRCHANCRIFIPGDLTHYTNSRTGCFTAPLKEDLCNVCNEIIVQFLLKKYCIRHC